MVVLQIAMFLVCSWEEVSLGSFYSAILAALSEHISFFLGGGDNFQEFQHHFHLYSVGQSFVF